MARIYETFKEDQAAMKEHHKSVIRYKKLHPDAIIPKRAKEGDAGFDLYAINMGSVCGVTVIETGVSCAIPDGYVGIIKPRSGLSAKYGADVLAGVVDSGYRGQLKVVLTAELAFSYDVGDRIAQMVVVPYMGEAVEVDDLDDTERGSTGFGSTGS